MLCRCSKISINLLEPTERTLLQNHPAIVYLHLLPVWHDQRLPLEDESSADLKLPSKEVQSKETTRLVQRVPSLPGTRTHEIKIERAIVISLELLAESLRIRFVRHRPGGQLKEERTRRGR
jgi:hypothetical protein